MDELKLGWHPDPFGLHQLRYFSDGRPTKLVRDGGHESYDPPPTDASSVTARPSPWVGQAEAEPASRFPVFERRRRLPAILIAVVVVVAAVAGLAAAKKHSGRSPATLLRSAASKTESGRTAHFAATVTTTDSGQTEPAITLSGVADFTSKATEIRIDGPSRPGAAVIRYIGGVGYFQLPYLALPAGIRWVRVDPRELANNTSPVPLLAGGDPTEGLQFLGVIVGDPVEISHEVLGGVAATHYSVTLNLSRFVDNLGQAEGSLASPEVRGAIQQQRSQTDFGRMPAEVWLDPDGRVRRFDFTLSSQGGDMTYEEKLSTTFSDFGACSGK